MKNDSAERLIGKITASVANDIRENKLLVPGQKVLVALSGGPDSAALLDLLFRLSREMDISLGVAHLHHGWRGREADGDQEFCRRLAKSLALPFYTTRIEVKAYARRRRISLETAAREVRRAFLKKVAMKYGYHCIATGHTANDQAETVLMHLIRGCGPDGLAGMSRSGDGFIRPLLGLDRGRLIAYLQARGLDYRIDRTNYEKDAFRNRIRLELLPLLQGYNPKIVDALCRLADNVRDDRELVAEAVDQASGRCCFRREGEVSIDLPLYKSYNKCLQKNLIRQICRQWGGPEAVPDHHSIIQVLKLAESGRTGAKTFLTGHLWARREYDRLVLGPRSKTGAGRIKCPRPQRLGVPGSHRWGSWLIHTEIIPKADQGIDFTNPHHVYFDWEELVKGGLFIKPIPTGTRMRLFGSGRTKKVQDILVDAKIPKEQRRFWPAIFWGRELIWLVGLRRASLAPITQTTKQVLKISVEPYGGKGI